MTTPQKMRQVQAATFGGPEVLVVREVPTPSPGPGQVLLRVTAAAVNYSDVMRRRASAYPFPTPLPYLPGGEVAGTVERLGEGVSGPKVGSPVFAVVGGDGSGGYAQFALAQAASVIPLPPQLEPTVACGLVIAGATAVLLLRDAARLQSGERVLVPAAGGGVGTYAVQLARSMGAGLIVAAAGSPERRALALKLGADRAVDSTRPEWPELVREATAGQGVDVALEMGGGAGVEGALRCLAPFGRVVVYGSASGAPHQLPQRAVDAWLSTPALNQSVQAFNLGLYFGLKAQAAQAAVETLLGAVLSGAVKTQVGQVFPLAEAAAAHRALEARKATGKLVLDPWR